jgi:PAS domain S-box-containing protein
LDERDIESLALALTEAREARAAAKEELAEAQTHIRHLEAALELVPVGVILADQHGRIFHGNTLVETLLRHPVLRSENVDAYGEWVSYHEDGRRVESHEYPLARVLREGLSHCELDVDYQRGDGTRFWMRIIGRPTITADGKTIGASVAVVDIDTERRLLLTQQVLINELHHRVKNAFSVIKSIVSMSLGSLNVDGAISNTINQRLDAYCLAHSKLIGEDWEEASVREVICDIVERTAFRRVTVVGPEVSLPSRSALALSMAMYELSTNAVKYGSLSVARGRVHVEWSVEQRDAGSFIIIRWMELDGPPAITPTRAGFGSFIIGDAMAMETGGKVDLTYNNKGFQWQLTAPLTAAEAATK